MGHGTAEKFEVPDWRQYKVEGIKELEYLQKILSSRGLKDPWIRNEVWRYQQELYAPPLKIAMRSLGRGFKYAAGAMLVTIALDSLYQHFRGEENHDSHH